MTAQLHVQSFSTCLLFLTNIYYQRIVVREQRFKEAKLMMHYVIILRHRYPTKIDQLKQMRH